LARISLSSAVIADPLIRTKRSAMSINNAFLVPGLHTLVLADRSHVGLMLSLFLIVLSSLKRMDEDCISISLRAT
jgi:hypothetical protein